MEGFLNQPSPSNSSVIEPTEAAEPVTEVVVIPETTTEAEVWYAFYNPSLLKDSDTSNDFYFGYSANFTVQTPESYHGDLKNRMLVDPALTGAEMGAVDYVMGTRFIGEDYDKCADWLYAMNLAKTRFMGMSKAVYLQNLDKFFEYLNSADRIELRYVYGIKSQLGMTPYTANGVPDIISLDVGEGEVGLCLVYIYYRGGQTLEVLFRVDRGYAPVVTVAEPVPETTVVPETTTIPEPTTQEPITTTPETTTTVPETTTIPETTTVPEKEPEAATYEYLEPNNYYSEAEQPQNSSFYPSYDEYLAQLEELNGDFEGQWGGPQD